MIAYKGKVASRVLDGLIVSRHSGLEINLGSETIKLQSNIMAKECYRVKFPSDWEKEDCYCVASGRAGSATLAICVSQN